MRFSQTLTLFIFAKMATQVIHVDQWIDDNKQYFLPPVCNKMLHNEGQMKLFFVGGPNQRTDYHIEAGEELFMMLKGDMVLKIVERGVHKDVSIKEGEIFLLPGRIPHSPQRYDNTVGLVIERDRHPDTEKDGLRYYIEKDGVATLDSLYEDWFYCVDLGSQLAPIIKAFFASEQYKTGKPGTIPEICPLVLDTERSVEAPFSLRDWIKKHSAEIDQNGRLPVFNTDNYQFQVYVYGKGEIVDQHSIAEAWIWQWEGDSDVSFGSNKYTLHEGDSLLVPVGQQFCVAQQSGSHSLVCYQDPTKSTTWPKN